MLGAALEDGIAEVVEAAGGAQGLVFTEILDREVGEFGRGILNKIAEHGFLVVADQIDFVDRGDLADGGEAVPDDGVAGNVEEGLANSVRLAPQREAHWMYGVCIPLGRRAKVGESGCREKLLRPAHLLTWYSKSVTPPTPTTNQDHGLGGAASAGGLFAVRNLQ